MKKTEIKGLDLFVYEETLENGLRIFCIPKENSESIYATFTTNFGAYQTEFIPAGEKEYVRVPDGIAHFLEHKMFEQENEEDVMGKFSSNGVSSNANTSTYKTTYLFDGSSKFDENLNLLLDYVQSPYYTDENVEKEKHIIEQEIDMTADNPYRAGMQRMMRNIFELEPAKIPTIGSKESVRSITKEQLYTCYHTFYHPGNMFLVVTGNIDPEHVFQIVEENQAKKEFPKYQKPVVKTYDEPATVEKEMDVLTMNISVPKITLGYKFHLDTLRKLNLTDMEIRRYVSIYANLKFGGVSDFLENARKDEVIVSNVDYGIFSTDSSLILMLETDSKKVEEVFKRIDVEVQNKEIDAHLFELKKKGMIASCIYMSEDIYGLNQKLMGDMIDTGTFEADVLDHFKALNFEDFMRVVEALNFKNCSKVIVNPK